MDRQHATNPSGPDGQQISDYLGRAVAGDGAALERLVEEVSPILVSWARSKLGRAERTGVDAEDLVQDVWLRVLPRLPDLAPHPRAPQRLTPALMALVGTILRNAVVDARRQAARARLHGLANGVLAADRRPASTSGPFAKALRSERRRLVQDALARLSERERALYLERLFGGLSIDELAAEFGMSREAVIKARQRVRHKLAGILAPQLLEELDELEQP